MSVLRCGLVVALVALPACGNSNPSGAPQGAPDVLLITIDTLRADHLGFYGYAKPTSPALDAFAAGAVVFENAEASAPWTLPALSSLMTSEVVSTHDCWDFGSVLDDSFTTLPERLLAAGYDTACVVSHLFTTSRHGLQQGMVHTDDSYAYPEVDPAQNITSQAISDKAIRFLDQKKNAPEHTPWFLWLHYFDPHEDYMPHPGITENFVTPGERTPGQIYADLYDGEIRYTDQHIGRVLDHLGALGFAAHTIVVVIADHGEEFYERGALGHGHSLHRELLHVPFAIRAPGCAPRRVGEIARQIDLVPTLLELIGLPPAPLIAGRSLVPALRGQPLEEKPALAELQRGPHPMESLRTQRFKLIRSTTDGAQQLFDLEADPQELHDVAAEQPARAAELAQVLDTWKSAARERARLFGTRAVALTPAQNDDLRALGYNGEDRGAEESRAR